MTLINKRRKSLTDILSTFKKTITDLEALASGNRQKAERNDDVVAVLGAQSASLRDEANKAHVVAERIEKLIEA